MHLVFKHNMLEQDRTARALLHIHACCLKYFSLLMFLDKKNIFENTKSHWLTCNVHVISLRGWVDHGEIVL